MVKEERNTDYIKGHAKKMEKLLEELKKVKQLQCCDGNWDYDPYMLGMANGLILAVAIMSGEEPEFMNPPNRWRRKEANIQSTP